MADTKLTALTNLATPASTDLLYVAADPGASPVSRKATIAAVVAAGHSGRGTAVFTVDGVATATAGKLRIYNKSGATRTIVRVWVAADTAPTGADLTVDIHKSGTTIHTTQSNRAHIDAGAYYGDTATIEVASWADAQYLTMDVDIVGATIPGSDVTVGVEYTY